MYNVYEYGPRGISQFSCVKNIKIHYDRCCTGKPKIRSAQSIHIYKARFTWTRIIRAIVGVDRTNVTKNARVRYVAYDTRPCTLIILNI